MTGRQTVRSRPYIHHDYAVPGVQDMLTSWIPLMDIPVSLGGLAAPGPSRFFAAHPGWQRWRPPGTRAH